MRAKSETSRKSSRVTKAPSQKRDRKETEAKILNAGITAFGDVGFDGATTKLVAKLAGVNESLIIRYFGTKEGLLAAIFTLFVEQVREQTLDYPPGETLEEELLRYIRFTFEHHRDPQKAAIFRAVFSRAIVDESLRKTLDQLLLKEGDPQLLARLHELKRAGKFPRKLDTKQIQTTFFSLLIGTRLTLTFLLQLDEEETEARLYEIVQIYLRGLMV